MMDFTPAGQIADAVLYEGYILYPYRASAQKNRLRWQFGVLAPRFYSERIGSDPWAMQTECIVEFEERTVVQIRLRFLQVQARTVEQRADHAGELFRPVDSMEIDGTDLVNWEEGVKREVAAIVELRSAFSRDEEIRFGFEGKTKARMMRNSEGKTEARIVQQSWPVSGRLAIGSCRVSGLSSLAKLRIRVENDHPSNQEWQGRHEALRQSLIATHLLLGVEQGKFVSLLDPPERAAEAASSCENLNTWPVLVGDCKNRDLMLSAPIMLYDYPAVAPESSGDFFDATEIDELLALRTIALTDDEKREAKATDEKGAKVLQRVEAMCGDAFARLHGALRERSATDALDEKAVRADGVSIATGSKVRLRPRLRQADAQDMFLDGRIAIVNRIVRDEESNTYVAVTLVDDPAADLYEWHGRFHYFYLDEIEPLIAPEATPLDPSRER